MMKFETIKSIDNLKPSTRTISRVFIHCSASDHKRHDNAETIDRWHRQSGWSGIGYHYFIRRDGSIQHGRDIDCIPAAQRGYNVGSIAICVHGLTESLFTREQKLSLLAICKKLNKIYSVTFHGHREVSAKICPVLNYKNILSLSPSGVLGGFKANTTTSSTSNSSLRATANGFTVPLLKKGDKGAEVAIAQLLLRVAMDGYFGGKTEIGVFEFQQKHKIKENGVIDFQTWLKLRGG